MLIDFSRFRWLALVATLTACEGDMREASQRPAAPDTGARSGSAGDAEYATVEESREPRADVQPGERILTFDGWGPLRIGMSLAEITAAAGADAEPGAVGGPDPERCDEFRPVNAPEGVLVMVENGVLTRISVSRNRDIETPEGFGVGDPSSEVLAAYGSRARVDPHQYWEAPAKYITVWREAHSDGNPRGIRYEIDSDGNIAHLRAGGASIGYVEGCI